MYTHTHTIQTVTSMAAIVMSKAWSDSMIGLESVLTYVVDGWLDLSPLFTKASENAHQTANSPTMADWPYGRSFGSTVTHNQTAAVYSSI